MSIQSKLLIKVAENKGITSYEGSGNAFKFLAVLLHYMSFRHHSDRHGRYLRKLFLCDLLVTVSLHNCRRNTVSQAMLPQKVLT